MSAYAPAPPADGWERVAAALEKEEGAAFPGRLQNLEVQPPAGSWNKIEAALPGPSISAQPQRKRTVLFSRMAAAAVLIGLTLVLVNRFWNDEPKGGSTAVVSRPVASTPARPATPLVTASAQKTATPPNEIASNPISARASTPAASRKTRPVPSRTISAPRGTALAYAEATPATPQPFIFAFAAGRYMLYREGDGRAVKLPKKLFGIIDCARRDLSCKTQMQQLQRRFASTAMGTDFTSVLEMIKTLRENQ
jgi:hypothetical protein